MKNTLLISLITIVVLVGMIVGGIFWINTTNQRFNFNTMSISKLTTKNINLNELDNIDLNIRTAKVIVEESNTNSITLKNVTPHDLTVDSERNLKISQEKNNKHQLEIGKSAVIIIKSKQDLNSIKVNQLNGEFKIRNLNVNNMEIDHTNGSTIIDNLKLNNGGVINKKNGKTELTDVNIPGLKVNVKTGAFKSNGTKKNNSYNDDHHEQLIINSNTGQVSVNTK